MNSLLGFVLISVLILIVIVQIAKVTELAGIRRGDKETQKLTNKRNANYMLWFLAGFMIFCVVSALHYKNYFLGYGPHSAASAHGTLIDTLFNTTLIFTGIVFVVTHIALFYFSWKYKEEDGVKAEYIAHDTRLEIIWTAIPAVVMAILVVFGLSAWNEIMADTEDEFIEIEATGYQFGWHLRYPGSDNLLGTRNYKMIDGSNPIGQDWEDIKNHDDLHPGEIVLPVGEKVRVRITARDVLHNFYLPHFRVKMDAVPGMPTYFVFTPEVTTEEYRQRLKNYPEYQIAADETEQDGPQKWEAFNFELACAELCGKGHFSMKRVVKIVEREEYEEWLAAQQPYYMTSIRNTDADPYKGQKLASDSADEDAPIEEVNEEAEVDLVAMNAESAE